MPYVLALPADHEGPGVPGWAVGAGTYSKATGPCLAPQTRAVDDFLGQSAEHSLCGLKYKK